MTRRAGRTRAFQQAQHGRASIRREVLAHVNAAQNDGKPGLNTYEIEQAMKAVRTDREQVLHQTVSAVVNELVAEGSLVWTEIMRPTGSPGRLGEVVRIGFASPTGERQPRLL